MANFSEKTSFIIESFQRDRGETPAVSEEHNELKAILKDVVRYKIVNEQSDVSALLASLKQGESVKSGPYKGLGRGALERLQKMQSGNEEEKEKAAEYGKERELDPSVEAIRKAGESRWFGVTKEGEVDPDYVNIGTDVALSLIPAGGLATGATRLALSKSPLARTAVSKGLDVVGKLVGRTPTSKLAGAAKTARESKGLVAGVREVEKQLVGKTWQGIKSAPGKGWEGTKWAAKKLTSKKPTPPTPTPTPTPTPGAAAGAAVEAGAKSSLIPKPVKWVWQNPKTAAAGLAAAGEAIPLATGGALDPVGAVTGSQSILKSAGEGDLISGKTLHRFSDYILPTKTGMITRGLYSVPGVAPAIGDALLKSAAEQSGKTPEEVKGAYTPSPEGLRDLTDTPTSTPQKQKSTGPTWEEFRDYFKGRDPNANEEAMRKSWERQFGGN